MSARQPVSRRASGLVGRAARRCRSGWPAAPGRSRRRGRAGSSHADTRVTAGRRRRSTSSVRAALRPSGGLACRGRRPTASSSSRPVAPRAWRSSSPRTERRSSAVSGGRWAMPMTARSDSTKRTGEIAGHGPALPPRRHRLGDAPRLAPQLAGVLQPQPGLRRGRRDRRAGPELLALVEGPLQSAPRVELVATSRSYSVEQVLDVGRGVGLLAVGERAAQPVGEALALAAPSRRARRRGGWSATAWR